MTTSNEMTLQQIVWHITEVYPDSDVARLAIQWLKSFEDEQTDAETQAQGVADIVELCAKSPAAAAIIMLIEIIERRHFRCMTAAVEAHTSKEVSGQIFGTYQKLMVDELEK